jgi:hypothetical protein
MNILKQVDIENEIRLALADYFEAYCRPLPETYGLPNVLIEQTGGSSLNEIDTFQVRLSVRAETDEDASDAMRDVLGVLEAKATEQFGALRHVSLNSLASWSTDPARPDLKLCTALVLVTTHRETVIIPES